jgi:hypothetical protein
MQVHPAQAVKAGKLPLPWSRDPCVHHKVILRINLKIEFTTFGALNLTRRVSAAAAAAAALQPPRLSHASEFAFGAPKMLPSITCSRYPCEQLCCIQIICPHWHGAAADVNA